LIALNPESVPMTMPEPLTVRLVSSYLGAYARHLRTYGHVTAWIGTPTRDQAESVLLDLAAELGVEPEQLSIEYLGDEFVTSSVIYRLVM
jgi:hypothetical protein